MLHRTLVLFSSFMHVCMWYMCVHVVYVCPDAYISIHACLCGCICGGLRLVSGNFLQSYSTYFFEVGFLIQTQNCPIHLVLFLACLLWCPPASGYLRQPATNTVKLSYPSRIYVGSGNLNSSCLACLRITLRTDHLPNHHYPRTD